jgi:hypothetical protein
LREKRGKKKKKSLAPNLVILAYQEGSNIVVEK